MGLFAEPCAHLHGHISIADSEPPHKGLSASITSITDMEHMLKVGLLLELLSLRPSDAVPVQQL